MWQLATSDSRGILSKQSHPILRCPVEILRCIFEATTDGLSSPYGYSRITFYMAMRLSEVCRKWRTICLDSPRLWSVYRMHCMIDRRSISRLKVFWERLSALVKHAPMLISIQGITDYFPYSGIRLDKFPVIERLELNFSSSRDFRISSNPGFPRPQGTLRELCISISRRHESIISTRDIDQLLLRFPQICSLHLDLGGILQMSGHIYNSIHTLSIHHAQDINALSILASLPRLQRSKFLDIDEIKTTTNTSVKLTDLKSLGFRLYGRTSTSWLARLDCPNLEELTVWNHLGSQDILAFISSHRSILSLIYLGYYEDLDQLDNIAPQLQHLGLSYQEFDLEFLCDNTFFNLRSLTIFGDGFPLTRFETLVKSRCLPSAHPESQLATLLKPLEILEMFPYHGQRPEREESGRWFGSRLIGNTTQDERSVMNTRVFSWV